MNVEEEIKQIKKQLKALERPVALTPEERQFFAPEDELSDIALQVEALLKTLQQHAPKFYRHYDAVHTELKNGEFSIDDDLQG